ncbi:MAG: tetratricopeptide repeat protein, partial [Leptolyngbyaceae cyanobacterium bins.59]|nr:tetratricopeptide repeat protein [Leptolyngbyaceae cyanobacterium bins.59]
MKQRQNLLIALILVGLLLLFPAPVAQATSLNLDATQALLHIGIDHFQSGEYPKALSAFTQLLQLDPKSATAYSNRCLIHLHLEAYSAAVADCSQALEYNPSDREAYLNRGLAYYHLNQYQAAVI